MAHLPETVDHLDETSRGNDPVVRAPKQLVVLPEPATFPRRTVLGIALVGWLLGATLGAVGLGIVYATRRAPARTPASIVPRAIPAVDSSPPLLVLEARDAGGAPVATGAGVSTGPVVESRSARLGRGRTLPQVLASLGLDRRLAYLVVKALRPLVNMRGLQPDDVLLVQRDPESHGVRRVEFRRSDTQVWAVTVDPSGTNVTGEKIDVVKTTVHVATGFVADGAIEPALAKAGLSADVIARLQEAFTSLDLARELHRGDTVRVVLEEERLNGVFFRYGPIEAIDFRGASGHRRAYFQHLGAHGDWFDASGSTTERGPLHAPVPSPRITSPFNPRRMHPILHVIRPHMGVDFGAASGTPVSAAADGVVLSVGNAGPAGNLVRLSHPALGVETGYAHLSRFAPGIHAGMHVHARQLIGYVGTTGRSTGPHLHFSLKRNGTFVDPLTMYGGRRAVPSSMRSAFDATVARLGAELDAIRIAGEPSTAPAPGATASPTAPDAGAIEAPTTVEDEAPAE